MLEAVQKRRREVVRSEKAAYWALFNTSIALISYYDLCYLKVLSDISVYLTVFEWLLCALFTTTACYDFIIHFWAHTVMRPIVISPSEKRLLGIHDDEFGFKIQESPPVNKEPIYDNLPPYEIHYSFEEDEKVVQPSERIRKVIRSEATSK